MNETRSLPSAAAFRFVLIIGIANLFADMTSEGARSVTGAFLGALGASAVVIGCTTGLGELLGYALHSVVADLVRREKRGTAFGVFDIGFGMAWFMGSAVMGTLYQHFLPVVVVLSSVLQLTSVPFFLVANRARCSP